MTRHDELIRLQHMLDAAREAVELVRGQAAQQIEGDRLRVLCNEIIHGYSTIDLEIVLKTVETRLPLLIRQLEAALR